MARFGDIAHRIDDRVEDPAQSGVERYVGLEHLEPESLKIRRWWLAVPSPFDSLIRNSMSGYPDAIQASRPVLLNIAPTKPNLRQ